MSLSLTLFIAFVFWVQTEKMCPCPQKSMTFDKVKNTVTTDRVLVEPYKES